MSGTLVVLILGILVIAFLVYFTHTILRSRVAAGADVRPAAREVRESVRRQVADEARAASRRREPAPARAASEADDAVVALGETPKVRPSRCLWVDDDPDGNVHERRMLELLEVDIDLARSTNQALQFLVGRSYDVVITDLSRPLASGGVDERAGIKLLKMLAGAPAVPPVIVYPDDVESEDPATEDPATEDAATEDAATEDPATTDQGREHLGDDDDDDDDDGDEDGDEDGDAGGADRNNDDDPDGADRGDDGDGVSAVDAAGTSAGTAGTGAMPPPHRGTPASGDAGPARSDPRLADAHAAGARATVTSPAALLRAVLAVVGGN